MVFIANGNLIYIEPEENLSAEDTVYKFIKKAIVAQELRPNAQIVESWVADQTGYSRTPIRAALKRLHYEGMVSINPGKGAYVNNPSHQEIRDTFEGKMLIETEAIRLACVNITQEEISSLEDLLELSMERHSKHDFDVFTDLNHQFHMIIAHASGNCYYEKFIRELSIASNMHLLLYDDFRETELGDMESFKEHARIIEAIKARDPDRCEKEMIRHVENTYYTLNLRLKLRTEKL